MFTGKNEAIDLGILRIADHDIVSTQFWIDDNVIIEFFQVLPIEIYQGPPMYSPRFLAIATPVTGAKKPCDSLVITTLYHSW